MTVLHDKLPVPVIVKCLPNSTPCNIIMLVYKHGMLTL